jgi:hypothetical protein
VVHSLWSAAVDGDPQPIWVAARGQRLGDVRSQDHGDSAAGKGLPDRDLGRAWERRRDGAVRTDQDPFERGIGQIERLASGVEKGAEDFPVAPDVRVRSGCGVGAAMVLLLILHAGIKSLILLAVQAFD